ncbi:glycosyltransferase family 88 protein [Legionella nagasakiensis]|uniref:glycosyltransferase family 88 protein n=1 Tax=Legionella nagasakiensis TaxID=535290 RepID=UPI001055561B|nr:glycosyltransferase family 88 protein [Legionella nagasakiensis]
MFFDQKFKMNNKNWVKIWFSTNPQEVVTPTIADQLITLGIENPQRKFTLVFSSSILDEEGRKKLNTLQTSYHENDFCNLSLHIEFLDIDSPDFIEKLDENEQELFEYARLELRSFSHGGNPAAASDIIRLLSPCYKQGIYTDFDVLLDFSNTLLSESGHEDIPAAVLIPTISYKGRYCNDVIIIASGVKAAELDFIKCLQAGIVQMYRGEGLENILNNMQMKRAEDDEKQLDQMIKNVKRQRTTRNPLIALRAEIEKKIKEGRSLDFWTEAYKQSVMQASGPGMYRRVIYDQQFSPASVASYHQVEKLRTLIKSQIDGQKNTASWIPQSAKQGLLIMNTIALSEGNTPLVTEPVNTAPSL